MLRAGLGEPHPPAAAGLRSRCCEREQPPQGTGGVAVSLDIKAGALIRPPAGHTPQPRGRRAAALRHNAQPPPVATSRRHGMSHATPRCPHGHGGGRGRTRCHHGPPRASATRHGRPPPPRERPPGSSLGTLATTAAVLFYFSLSRTPRRGGARPRCAAGGAAAAAPLPLPPGWSSGHRWADGRPRSSRLYGLPCRGVRTAPVALHVSVFFFCTQPAAGRAKHTGGSRHLAATPTAPG